MQITVQPVPVSRTLNQALRLLDETFASPEVRAYPRYLGVTITGDCNIKCIYCERQRGHNVRDYYFPTDLYEQMEPHFHAAQRVTLLGLGEPFMHKDFERMVRMAKAAGAECITTTNATMLNDRYRRMLVEIGLDYLGVSVDSPDPATFELMRAGAKYERIMEYIRALRDLKRELGVDRPRIGLCMTVSRDNVWHIPNMVRLAAELGAVDLHLQNVVLYRKEDAAMSVLGTWRMDWMVSRARKLAADLGIGLYYVPRDPYTPEFAPETKMSAPEKPGRACREAWTQFLVYDNGDVHPCCFTEETFGNLRQQSLEAIHFGEKATDFRRRIWEGKLPAACVDCGYLIRRDPAEAERNLAEARALLSQLSSDEERAVLSAALAETEARMAAPLPRSSVG
ncbi:radical SAM protein [bacterium]|nr:radical SAM protein [bacterium]